jgi:hypothetical protein
MLDVVGWISSHGLKTVKAEKVKEGTNVKTVESKNHSA